MLRILRSLVASMTLLPACGGGNDGTTVGGSGGVPSGGGGAGAPGGGAGATGGNAASNAGGGGGASSNGGAGGAAAHACIAPGTRLASGACYVPCTYAPAFPPLYEDPAASCTNVGWKCTPFQYCNPNIHCQMDASCQKLAGPGWICVPTPTGPLVGQCALPCETDADCPDSKGTTPSPYTCLPVDNGTTVVKICRF